MAPRKRKAERVEEAAAKPVAETKTTSKRVTRSTTRRANSNSAASASELAKPEFPSKSKKAKTKATGKKKKEEVKAGGGIEPEKEKFEEDDVGPKKEDADEDAADGNESKEKTVVIEHCKQCNSFKTRANQVKDGLEKGVPGIKVLLNPEKPRRGCFEIREEGGENFISLLDMKRPFKPMKDLDMKEVISDIVAKLK